MKSKEFITEASIEEIIATIAKEYNISDENMAQMVKIARDAEMKLNVIEWCIQISQQCQPFIREVGWDNAFKLFRGVSSEYTEFIKKRVRLEKRVPKSMDPFLFDQINNYFTKMYGGPFRNAMLATGDRSHTTTFGNIYMVFPIGDFKFLWNQDVKDFNFSYADFTKTDIVQNNVEGSVWASDNRDLISDLFMEHFIETTDWHTIDMKAAIESEAEIMIRCQSYYGIYYNDHRRHVEALREIMRLAV